MHTIRCLQGTTAAAYGSRDHCTATRLTARERIERGWQMFAEYAQTRSLSKPKPLTHEDFAIIDHVIETKAAPLLEAIAMLRSDLAGLQAAAADRRQARRPEAAQRSRTPAAVAARALAYYRRRAAAGLLPWHRLSETAFVRAMQLCPDMLDHID